MSLTLHTTGKVILHLKPAYMNKINRISLQSKATITAILQSYRLVSMQHHYFMQFFFFSVIGSKLATALFVSYKIQFLSETLKTFFQYNKLKSVEIFIQKYVTSLKTDTNCTPINFKLIRSSTLTADLLCKSEAA